MFLSDLNENQVEHPEEEPTGDPTPVDAKEDEAEQSQNSNFVLWPEGGPDEKSDGLPRHQTIVKKNYVKQGKRQIIVPKMPINKEPEEADVHPILDGDQVVGIEVVCHCGAVHEIRFEYDEPQ